MQETPIREFQMDKTDFLKRLRNHTQLVHTSLEQHPISTALFRPNVNQTDYTCYLQIMHEVVFRFEEQVFPLLKPLLPDIDQRCKTDWLEEDLRQLGAWPAKTRTATLSEALPYPHNLGYLMGRMYVLEGSTLGGAVIYRQLQPVLNITPEKGGRYFYGYGPETGGRWKTFTDRLSTMAVVENESENILKGALAQFVAMQAFFDTQLSVI